jgi:glycosyltransferase involved in cell wall biosynthesis
MRQLRIAHVAPRYFPALGGVEEVVRRCAELQAAHGHAVSVITSNLLRPGSQERLPAGRDLVQGVQVFRCRAWVLDSGRFYFLQSGVLRTLRSLNLDIVHIHANKCFATDLVAAWCRLGHRPFVFSPYAGKLGSTRTGKLHNATVGRLAFSANVVQVISESEERLVRNTIPAPVRLALVPCGLDLDEILRVRSDVFKRWGILEKHIILGVGRLEHNKGFDVLLNAFSQVRKECPDTRLVIVGDDFGVRDNLEQQSVNLGVADAVTFAGRLSRGDLISALQHCTVCCHPARTEAFGIVVAEAMAAGAPVVCSRIPSLQELVGPDERGFSFELENVTELVGQLLRLVRDPALRSSLGSRAREFASRFTWENTSSRLEELYVEILNRESAVTNPESEQR